MVGMLTALWSEPRPRNPPPVGRWDRLLVGSVALLTTADALLRDNQLWRPTAIALGLLFAATLYCRRTQPLRSFLLTFLASFAIDAVAAVQGAPWDAPPSHVLLLLLPYALFRWGSGREAAMGLLVLMGAYGIAAASGELTSTQEAVGAAVMLLFPAVLGTTVRFRAQDQARALDEVRLREREQLARELHDTVAHHVSAIAIQAQAGQAVAAKDPERALANLAVIEQAASRTLSEMRDIVGALRTDGEVDLEPMKGLSDLDELKAGAPRNHTVEIEIEGRLDDLHPAVDAALYRMVQESITNAARHAKNQSGVWVRLQGEGDIVYLTVSDDGEAPVPGQGGYGLVGLAERATLLGGTFQAGPGATRGWRVEAMMPKSPGRGGAL